MGGLEQEGRFRAGLGNESPKKWLTVGCGGADLLVRPTGRARVETKNARVEDATVPVNLDCNREHVRPCSCQVATPSG